MLKGKHITLVITGGIAAYKTPLLLRHLVKVGAQVRIAVTQHALDFVSEKTLAVLSGYPVLGGKDPYPDPVGHIALADWTDLLLVVPATANTLAKRAQGLADNEATSLLLAYAGSVLWAPAMNEKMWIQAPTQENVQALEAEGHTVLLPAYGFLAEGYAGRGRLPALEAIFWAVKAQLVLAEFSKPYPLAGKKVVVSAGGTVEALDPVRAITNHSSGKMGLALATVASLLGAQVTFVAAGEARRLPVLPQIEVDRVTDARELAAAMVKHSAEADIVVMAAAVSDYRPQTSAPQKIKKEKGQGLSLDLVENPDILQSLPHGGQLFLVGFAAETEQVLKYARDKFQRKGVDLLVANDVSQAGLGFQSERNAAYLLTADGEVALPPQDKVALAGQIFLKILASQ